MDTDPAAPLAERRVGRRRLVRGAAWAAPGVSLAAPAPVSAASCPGGCPNIGFGTITGQNVTTASNGWTITYGGGFGSENSRRGFRNDGLQASGGSIPAGTVYAGTDMNPTALNTTITVAQTGHPIQAGCSHVISVDIVHWATTGLTQGDVVLTTRVGGITVGLFSTAGIDIGNNTRVVPTPAYTVPPGVTGAVSFVMTWATVSSGDDLFIFNPTVTCS